MANQFTCQACGLSFPAQQALMEHARTDHSAPQTQQQAHQHFTCQSCGAEFHSTAELQQHGKSAHAM